MKFIKYSFLVTITYLIVSCTSSTSKKEEKQLTTPPNDGIHTLHTYNALKEKVSWSWAYLDSCEKEKITLVNRLLDEASYNPKHNSLELEKLRNLVFLYTQKQRYKYFILTFVKYINIST